MQLPSSLGLRGGLHNVSERVAAALEDMRPQQLVHPHFLHGSAMDGLLGVIVFDEVDRKSVLMSVGHGYRRAERDGWVVAKYIREFYNLDLVEADGFLLFLDIGDDIADSVGTDAIFFFWYGGKRQRRNAEIKIIISACGQGASRAANRLHGGAG